MLDRKPRLVLFDAVGTLLHPDPPVAVAYGQAGRALGSRRDEDEIRARFRAALGRYAGRVVLPLADTMRHYPPAGWRPTTSEAREQQRWLRIVAYVFDDIPERSHALFRVLWQHFADGRNWRLDPQLADVWRTLMARGYPLGLASNFDARLSSVCRAHPPLDRCAHLYYSSQLGFVKPDPRFYAAIEQRTGFRGAEILLVGDDPLHDFSRPRACGWQALLLDPAHVPGAPDAARLSELTELVSLL